jgi:hypothetical protein
MTTTETAENRWSGMTEALLLGFVGMAALLHQSFVQGAGFVPAGASQLMMWVAVVGIVGYVALRRGLAAGYWLAFLAGLLYLASTGLIVSGALGPLPEGGPVIGFVLGPIAQGAYAVVLIAVTYVALRERGGRNDVSESGGDVTAQSQ